MLIINIDNNSASIFIDWKVVQDGIFRYIAFVSDEDNIVVRMVFEEMFYAEVVFQQGVAD